MNNLTPSRTVLVKYIKKILKEELSQEDMMVFRDWIIDFANKNKMEEIGQNQDEFFISQEFKGELFYKKQIDKNYYIILMTSLIRDNLEMIKNLTEI